MAGTYNTADLLPTNSLSLVGSGTGLDPFYGIDMADALGLKYIFQKGQTPRVYDGTTLNKMSGTAPGTFSISATTASGVGFTAKTYYTVVYFDPSHEDYCTTGPYADLTATAIFPAVTPSAQDVNCTISDPPSTEPRLIKARVFRALNETADMRQLTGTGTYSDVTVTPGGGGVHLFTDTGAVTEDQLATRDPLNLRKRYFADGLPPSSHTGCFYQGRMWMIDPTNGNLIYSEEELPEDFPTDNFLTILASDEDPSPWTVALRVNNNQLMAYTQRGCYLIAGSGPPYTVRALFRGVGPVSTQATIYADEAGIIFPAADAIYVHPGGSEVSRLGAPRQWPGMNPLEDLYRAIDKGRGESMVARLDRDRTLYTLAVPVADGDAVNNGGFEWDYVRSNWATVANRVATCLGYWTNVQGRLWPVFGDELGGIWQAELGNSEGLYPANAGERLIMLLSNTSAAGNALVLAGSGALAAAANTAGLPTIVRDDVAGSIIWQNRTLSYNSGTSTLTFLYPLGTGHAAGDIIEVGSVVAVWESGWWAFTKEFARCHLNYIYPMYLLKTSENFANLFIGIDQNETLQPYNNPNYSNFGFYDQNASPTSQVLDKIAINGFMNQLKLKWQCSVPGLDFGLYGADAEATIKPHRR